MSLDEERGDSDVKNTFRRLTSARPDLKFGISWVLEQWRDWLVISDDTAEYACALLLLLTPNVVTLRLMLPSFRIRPCDTQQFLEGRLVKHVEFYGPVLLNAALVNDAWAYVETLILQYAHISSSWLYSLCNDVHPPLKHLEIETSAYNDTKIILDKNAPGLNEALQLCRGTLQNLYLGYDGRLDMEPYLGPQGRLNLSSMEVFTSLVIQVRYLFNSLKDMRDNNICERLPRSLRTLRLNEEVLGYHDRDPWWDWRLGAPVPQEPEYFLLVNRAILQLGFDSSEWLPNLVQVEVTRLSHSWQYLGYAEQLRLKFGKQGRFSKKWRSYYDDELRKFTFTLKR
ncbi:hypothetical protein VTJ04DRAFT_10834 [Mycothermus thermophilus]|uniref:uncharacterized protein n=1 Tax=Humicola insolens TaxID=85995 RepID=UPI0037427444